MPLKPIAVQVQSQANLVKIVSKTVMLESSRRTLKGKCPFHKDEATSLMISPDKNIFKCFGCGLEGGPIEFSILVHQQSYQDAVINLATAIGISVPTNLRSSAV